MLEVRNEVCQNIRIIEKFNQVKYYLSKLAGMEMGL